MEKNLIVLVSEEVQSGRWSGWVGERNSGTMENSILYCFCPLNPLNLRENNLQKSHKAHEGATCGDA